MFSVVVMPRAIKDLEEMPEADSRRMYEKLLELENGLSGDVKKLSNFTPAYRLRSGDWRALFDMENKTIVVRRVIHRRDAYR